MRFLPQYEERTCPFVSRFIAAMAKVAVLAQTFDSAASTGMG
jgi:hypothetical protein